MKECAARDEIPNECEDLNFLAVLPPAAFKTVSDLDGTARRTEIATEEGVAVWREWGSGPPLVLLHGGSGSWMHFIRQIAFFSTGFRVLVPDMPGFGDSSAGPSATDPEAMARILSARSEERV